ncbi:unnamed protein product [Effrenium voratum]|uniref:Uncharacterized protein n=1 Tax=Effrenium voratum TaxID=2562239 RepID=A0AA36IZR7_9DINO|nr:unnamed protein product [Effrenium voratum]CAJ1425080.1 unnamed protein product [Effrenium voratum]
MARTRRDIVALSPWRWLLLPLLCERTLAAMPKTGTPAAGAHTGPGAFSPPDLAEPAELDLLDDSESKDMPWPQEQEHSESKPDRQSLLSIAGEHAWTIVSFMVGYAIVQYMLGSGRDPDTKEE